MDKITTCVFDAYGTLFDVNAACRELSKEVGDKWNELSSLWRLRQVEYTWLRNSMKEYIDFWKITSDALDYAMETLNIKNSKLRNELLSLYLKLEAYPEVKPVLENIKNMGLKTAILSNGNKIALEMGIQLSEYDKERKWEISYTYKKNIRNTQTGLLIFYRKNHFIINQNFFKF